MADMHKSMAPELPMIPDRRQPIERNGLIRSARRWQRFTWGPVPGPSPKKNAPQALPEHPRGILLSLKREPIHPKGEKP